MNELTHKKNSSLAALDWKGSLGDPSTIPLLQERLDYAEKYRQKAFSDFTDVEMMSWFLHGRKHLDKENDKSQRTINEYKRELAQFVDQLVKFAKEINLDVDQIIDGSLFKSLSPRHIRRYQEWLKEESPYVKKAGAYSPATLARKTTIIKNFLSFLYDSGYIQEPIHKGLYIATVRKDDRPNRDLGPEEVRQLLRYFQEKNHPIAFAIIHILTTTGIRNEEFCTLKLADLQYDSINQGYYLDIIGKGNKKRQVPLREKAFNSICMFRYARGLKDIDSADDQEPLFTTNTGKAYSPSYLSQYLTKEIQRTELPFIKNRCTPIGPHTFRHAFAIISHLSRVDLFSVMRSLGHEKVETTMIYLQKVFEKEQHAIHSWNAEVFGEYI